MKENNKKKINEMIKMAEGRATARTIDYQEVVDAIATLEYKLGIPKARMVGVTADIDVHAQVFASAYKYIPVSTHFTITRKKTGWDLVSVYRDTTRRHKRSLRTLPRKLSSKANTASKKRLTLSDKERRKT